jgi:hypothetical protein
VTLPRFFETLRHPHRDRALVEWAATRPGRVGVWVVAVALLALRDPERAATIGPILAFALALPARRNLALSVGGGVTLWLFAIEQQARHLTPFAAAASAVAPGAAALVLVLLYACFRAAVAFDRLPRPVRRWPQAWLHAILWVTLGAAWVLPARPASPVPALFRLTVACLPFLVWRCGYLLLSGGHGTAAGTSFVDHVL